MMRHSLRPEVRSALFGVMALTLGLLSPAAVDAARPLSIRTGSSLPSGTVGTPYSQALSAAGGTAPYTWSVTAGAVPAGLTLSSAGVLSGTPRASGTANFTVRVADSGTQSATKAFALTINSAAVVITTASPLPSGTVGAAYSQTLAASGGTPPYTWTMTVGAVPAGLTLSSAGVLSGTPTASGTANFTVQVTDSGTQSATKAFALTINGSAPIGQLTQLSGVSGCVSETATSGTCVDGVGLDGAGWVAISPDGNYAYVAAFDGSTVTTFSPNTTTGALTQLSGTAGCIAETGDGVTCGDGRGLSGAVAVVVSPDGNHVYVASRNNTVAIFSRNISTGVLTQLSGTAGCIADTGDGVTCADGVALVGLRGIAISPDGKSVYVTARDGNAVAIFSRNSGTGVLTQLSGTAGCVSSDGTGGSCVVGRGLDGARHAAVSPDNLFVYIASQNSNAVAVFARNTTTGALTQLSGAAGCMAETGDGVTCADGHGLINPIDLVVSPDGKNVYVASVGSSALTIFSRNTTTGALTQLSGPAGCIAETGDGVTCADGNGLDQVVFVTLSPDGNNVYAAAQVANAVTVFSRDVNTGALAQFSGLAGCISEDGTSGTCTDGHALNGALAVTVSPDGANVYAASYISDAVTIFSRNTGGGSSTSTTLTNSNTSAATFAVASATTATSRTAPATSLATPPATPSITFSIVDRGGVSLETAGSYISASIQPDAGQAVPSGVAFLQFRQNGVLVAETGFPASPVMQAGRIYAEVNGPVNTGAAITNPNDQPAQVSFFFTDPGGDFGYGTTSIPAKGHIAAFLNEAPFNSGAFNGTFTFASSAPVSVAALRGLINERHEVLITALPVDNLSAPSVAETLTIPYFADGGGWTTEIIMVNRTDNVLTGIVQLRDGSGQSTSVNMNGLVRDTVTYAIAPRTSQTLRTSGVGTSVLMGSVSVVPSPGMTAPAGFAIVSARNAGTTVTETSVLAVPAGTAFRLFAEAASALGAAGSIQPGIALTNASTTVVTVALEVSNLDGSSSGLFGTLTLPPNGHRATPLKQIQGLESLPSSFKGVVRLSSDAAISVMGIRIRYNERGEFLIAMTPPAVENAAPSGESLFFPYILDAVAGTTQIILFSGQTGLTSSGTLGFFSQSGELSNVLLK